MSALSASGCLVVSLVVWSVVAPAQSSPVTVHEAWVKHYPDVDTSILLLDSTLVYLNAGDVLIALTRGGAGVWTVS